MLYICTMKGLIQTEWLIGSLKISELFEKKIKLQSNKKESHTASSCRLAGEESLRIWCSTFKPLMSEWQVEQPGAASTWTQASVVTFA